MESKKVLLQLLSSYIHEAQSVCDFTDVDWQEVFSLSVEQAVAGVVFSEIQRQYETSQRLQNSPFRELEGCSQLKLEWYAMHQQVAMRNVEVNRVLYKLVKCLSDKRIASMLLKGQALAQFYPSPLARSSGDIDLYVGEEQYDDAKKVLRDGGLLVGNGCHEDFKHLMFVVDGVSVELHRHAELLPHSEHNAYLKERMASALRLSDGGFFVNAKGEADRECPPDGIFVRSLPDSLNVVYTFIHTFRHFIGGGISLKQVTDCAVLVKSLGSKHSRRIEEHLRKTGFLKPWQVFGCLMVNHLGLAPEEVPCYDARYDAKSEKVLKQIFDDYHNRTAKKAGRQGNIARAIGLTRGYFRTFSLFPTECVAFFVRLGKNVLCK